MGRRKSLRFAVGQLDGRRSSEWLVSVHKDDVYISNTALATARKVSLHPSGQWQEAFTGDYVRANRPSGPRWSQRWLRPPEIGVGVTLAFRIMVPTSELEQFPATKQSPRTVWVTPAPHDGYVQFEISLLTSPSPDDNSWPGKRGMGSQLIGRLGLSNGSDVFVTYTYHQRTKGDDYIGNQLAVLRLYHELHSDLAEMAMGAWHPGIRQVALADAPDGSRIYIECRDSRADGPTPLPATPADWLDMGVRLARDGVVLLANEAFRRALILEPSMESAKRNASFMGLATGRLDEARAELEEMLRSEPVLPEVRLNYAALLAMQAHYEDALCALDPLVGSGQVSAEVWHNRCIILGRLGRWPEALADAERALAIAPNDADSHYEKAKCLISLEDHDAAERAMRDATRLAPGNPNYRILHGQVLTHLDKHEAAIAVLDDAIWLGGGERAQATKARVLLELRRSKEALDVARVGLRAAPDDLELLKVEALALSYLDLHEDSERAFVALVQRLPYDPDVRGLHAVELLESNFAAPALAEAQAAERLGNELVGKYAQARAYLELGHHLKAAGMAAALVAQDPAMPDAQYILACAHAELGDFDRAFENLTNAVALGWTHLDMARHDIHLRGLRSHIELAPKFAVLTGG